MVRKEWGCGVWWYLIGRNYVLENIEAKTYLKLTLCCHLTPHTAQI
jgi:hypothetical protein